MTIEDLMKEHDGVEVIFNPFVSYPGEWYISVENLIKNSKNENGKNLFKEFYRINYTRPIFNLFNILSFAEAQISLKSIPNKNNIGRCLVYNKPDFYFLILNYLSQGIDRVGKTEDELEDELTKIFDKVYNDEEGYKEAFIQALREKIEKISDVIINKEASPYYYGAYEDFLSQNSVRDFKEFLISIRITINKIIKGLEMLDDFFDKPIDYHEIYKCFDPDTFYLLFARQAYEDSIVAEKYEGMLHNNFNYLAIYLSVTDEIAQTDKNYNPVVRYKTDGKNTRVSRRELSKWTKKLLESHPEVRPIYLPTLEGDKNYRDIKFAEQVIDLYDEELSVNWEFFHEDETIEKATELSENVQSQKQKTKKSFEQLLDETNERIDFMNTTGYIGHPIRGINTFNEYFAFLYPNGTVILESFWKNGEVGNPQTENAMYIMTIDNFIEMSRHSKLTLIEFMRIFPDCGIERRYHSSQKSWRNSVRNAINGTSRIEDVLAFVNELKSQNLAQGYSMKPKKEDK